MPKSTYPTRQTPVDFGKASIHPTQLRKAYRKARNGGEGAAACSRENVGIGIESRRFVASSQMGKISPKRKLAPVVLRSIGGSRCRTKAPGLGMKQLPILV